MSVIYFIYIHKAVCFRTKDVCPYSRSLPHILVLLRKTASTFCSPPDFPDSVNIKTAVYSHRNIYRNVKILLSIRIRQISAIRYAFLFHAFSKDLCHLVDIILCDDQRRYETENVASC